MSDLGSSAMLSTTLVPGESGAARTELDGPERMLGGSLASMVGQDDLLAF
jgi:hypothetical protein